MTDEKSKVCSGMSKTFQNYKYTDLFLISDAKVNPLNELELRRRNNAVWNQSLGSRNRTDLNPDAKLWLSGEKEIRGKVGQEL